MLEEIHLAHMPADVPLYVAYYRNVQNPKFIRDQLLAGNSDFEYAFLDASMVVSRQQILAATFRAMNDYFHDRLKSHNVHSEIVFALSPNNNIGEAFRRFGVQETTKNICVVKVATSPDITIEKVTNHLSSSIDGEEGNLDDEELHVVSDVNRIRKVYKLPNPQASASKSAQLTNGALRSDKNELHNLEVQILGLMALRGAT